MPDITVDAFDNTGLFLTLDQAIGRDEAAVDFPVVGAKKLNLKGR